MRLLFSIIGALFVTAAVSALRPSQIIQTDGPTMSDTVAPFSFSGDEDAVIGLYIEEIATGRVIAEYGADRAMCPASIIKSVTSASVLSLYPDDQCFATRVSTVGDIVGNVLHGNLVVEASGDPTLGSAYFDQSGAVTDSITAALHRTGIDSITGTVLIDSSVIPDPSYPPGWSDDDYMWPYGAMLRALNWRDNRYTLTLPSKATSPFIPDLTVDFRRQKRGKMGYDSHPPLNVVKAWGKPARRGSSVALAMPVPADAFIYAMKHDLRDAGIAVSDTAADAAGSVSRLTAIYSPAFPDILRSLMFRSDNLYAEGMLRTIAPRQPRDTATSRETALWALRGADTDSVTIIDGSGLSRLNRITPWFLSDVLSWMARSPRAVEYASLFPRVGREGTVRRFLAGTGLEGRLGLKTGTMSGVRALAGYLFDDEGLPTHTIVLIVNGFRCSPSVVTRAAQDFFLRIFDNVAVDSTATN